MTIFSSNLQMEHNKDLVPRPLNPLATYDATAMRANNQKWNTIWKVIAIVSAIAFIAIAAFASAYTSLFLAEHLPIVTIGVFAMLFPAGNFFKSLWEKSNVYAKNAKIDGILINNMKNPLPLPIKFIIKGESKEFVNLKARYQYMKDLERKYLDHSTKPLEEVSFGKKKIQINNSDHKIDNIDFSNAERTAVFYALQAHRVYQKNCREEAAISRLKAAHLLQLIQNPHEMRGVKDFVQFASHSYPSRLIAKDHQDKDWDILVKNSSTKFSDNEILKTSENNLIKKFFHPGVKV